MAGGLAIGGKKVYIWHNAILAKDPRATNDRCCFYGALSICNRCYLDTVQMEQLIMDYKTQVHYWYT